MTGRQKRKRGTNFGSGKRIVGLEFSQGSEKIVLSETQVCRNETQKKMELRSSREWHSWQD